MTHTEGTSYTIGVQVTLHTAVLDPQGQAILRGLHTMGYGSIREVHAGKYFRLVVDAASADEALSKARLACERLLTNPVIETFALHLERSS